MQLGYLLVLLDGEPNRPAAEACCSRSGPEPSQAPDFLRRRLFWSLAHWDLYDEEDRRQVDEQIRLAWRTAPGELADLTLDVLQFFARWPPPWKRFRPRDRFVAALVFASPAAVSATRQPIAAERDHELDAARRLRRGPSAPLRPHRPDGCGSRRAW